MRLALLAILDHDWINTIEIFELSFLIFSFDNLVHLSTGLYSNELSPHNCISFECFLWIFEFSLKSTRSILKSLIQKFPAFCISYDNHGEPGGPSRWSRRHIFYFSRIVIFSLNGEKSKMEICLLKRPPRSVNTSNNWHNEVSLIMQQLQQLCSQSDCNKLRQKHVCRALWLIDSNFNWIRQINIQFATANGMFRGLVVF